MFDIQLTELDHLIKFLKKNMMPILQPNYNKIKP